MRKITALIMFFLLHGGEGSTIEKSFEDEKLDSPLFKVTPEGQRFRYRLEGLESTWIEPSDEMNFVVYFIGQNRVTISRVAFAVSGTSAGWTGDIDSSPRLPRKETIPIPPGTLHVQFIITSSGSPRCVGTYLISDFSAHSIEGDVKNLLLENGSRSDNGINTWFKSGNNPAIPIRGPGFPADLRIIDTDLNAHGDWGHPQLPISGDKLILEWQEAYSLSQGGTHSLNYDRLPPGRYRFEVEELTIAGVPTDRVSFVDLVVPRPLYQTWWFWLLSFALLTASISLSVLSTFRRRIKQAVRHSQLIENERLRIAMDLHDDIGTRLSQISLISSHARMTATDSKSNESFQKITELTGELAGSLSETVWMLSPKNNDLESLIGFLCRTASELCLNAKIRCRIDADSSDVELPISQQFRHHFVLSVKEALNNAIKHSHADEIILKIKIGSRDLSISVADNGNGIPSDQKSSGNGLASLKRRMTEINGSLAVNSASLGGVEILLEAPLKQQEY